MRTEHGELCAYVYVDLPPGADLQGYVERARRDVAAAIASGDIRLRPGERVEWTGQYQLLLQGQSRLRWIVPLVGLSMLGLLFLQFGSLTEALIVLVSVPFALVGSIWTLFLLGYSLSAPVWVGLLSVVGLAMQTGVVMVVYIDEAYHRRAREGRIRTRDDIVEAHAEGTVRRLRPKVMTITTMAAGLLPLLWAEGAGADIMKRIAAPMLGGLLTSAFLTLEVSAGVVHHLARPAALPRAARRTSRACARPVLLRPFRYRSFSAVDAGDMAAWTRRPRWLRYVVAVGLTTMVVVGRLALDPVWGRQHNRHLVFLPTVMLAAWFGGFGPGFLSAALSTLALAYFWSDRTGPAHFNADLALFLFVAFWICAVIRSLQVARARADAAKKARESLMELVIHDLRNPLTAIRVAAESLEMDAQLESMRRRTSVITRAAARMEKLVRDLFEATQAERGDLRLALQREEAQSIVQEVLDANAPIARERGVSWNPIFPRIPSR